MAISLNQYYRVAYEAFSRFSNSLVRCRSFEAVADCFQVNLKYLFSFHRFRATYQRGNLFLLLEVSAEGATLELKQAPEYLCYEQELLHKRLPLHWPDLQVQHLPERFALPAEEQGALWAWLIENDAERHTAVSVLSGESKPFSRRDITFLKLVAESLEAKLFELCLLRELDAKNAEISSIMALQREVIGERTLEVAAKNAQLLEISVLNAHRVREPLSRVLGLVNLLEMRDWPLAEIKENIMPRLKTSAQDLDSALREVIEKSTADLTKLKA